MKQVKKKGIFKMATVLLSSFVLLSGCSSSETSSNETNTENGEKAKEPVELLNVSYDPTRELYEEFNKEFAASLERGNGSNRYNQPITRWIWKSSSMLLLMV